jgi:hypothetical protein
MYLRIIRIWCSGALMFYVVCLPRWRYLTYWFHYVHMCLPMLRKVWGELWLSCLLRLLRLLRLSWTSFLFAFRLSPVCVYYAQRVILHLSCLSLCTRCLLAFCVCSRFVRALRLSPLLRCRRKALEQVIRAVISGFLQLRGFMPEHSVYECKHKSV